MAVVPALPAYEVDKVYKQQIIITDSGTPKQTFKAELIVRACRYDYKLFDIVNLCEKTFVIEVQIIIIQLVIEFLLR